MSQTYVYPFDPTGSLTSNVIPNERHVLNGVTDREFSFIVPRFAPFFRSTNFRIRHIGLGRDLVEGVDFHLTHWFHAASHGVGRQLFGSITILDKQLTGVVELRYQTIGGDWVYDEGTILELMADRLTNPRITTWDQVVDLPFQFPVIDHEWDLADLTGARHVVEKLDEIVAAIEEANEANGQSHVTNYNNPHNVTKAQVGLSEVQNLPLANIAEATAGELNTVYMTPLRTRNFVESFLVPILEAHTLRNDNPHGVTKAQVGLSNVQNYGVATDVQAIAGASNTLYMTPLTVKSVIDNNVLTVIDAHTTRNDNPHSVSKGQVGLGSVENFPIASESEAVAGSRNDRYMTPLSTYQMVSQYVGEGMNNHISDIGNPHRVNKTQVGLGNVQNYGVATAEQAVTGTSDSLYITPITLRAAIEEVALATYRDHTNDGNNPHGVNKSQVGLGNVDNFPTATVEEAVTGTASNRFMTPATTSAMLASIVGEEVSGHAGRVDNPHGVTAEQIGAVTATQLASSLELYLPLGGTANDSNRLEGRTYADLVQALTGGLAEDTNRFGGYSVEELRDLYAPFFAPLATHLEGKSLNEVGVYSGTYAKAAPALQKAPWASPAATQDGWTKLFETNQRQFSALISISGTNGDNRVESSLVNFFDAELDTEEDLSLQRFFVGGRLFAHEVHIKRLAGIYSLWIKHNSVRIGTVSCVVNGVNRADDILIDLTSFEEEPDWLDLDPMFEAPLDAASEAVETLMTQSSVVNYVQDNISSFMSQTAIEQYVQSSISSFMSQTAIEDLVQSSISTFMSATDIQSLVQNSIADFMTATAIEQLLENRLNDFAEEMRQEANQATQP